MKKAVIDKKWGECGVLCSGGEEERASGQSMKIYSGERKRVKEPGGVCKKVERYPGR